MIHLPAELRVSAWSKLTVGGIEKLDLAKSVHKWCVDSILTVFGVEKNFEPVATKSPTKSPTVKKSKK